MSKQDQTKGMIDRLKETGFSDLTASFVVFLVALPLCMGIAIASGVPPALGLISGIIGGLVVGFLAGSPLQVSGPAAGLAVIVFELVNKFGLKMLGVIVLLAGALQVAAGVFRIGRWFRAVSPAVIHGMLAGIGVLIFAGQFHVMVDDKPSGSGLTNLLTIPSSFIKGILPMEATSHHLAAAIGVLSILVLVLWASFRPKKLSFLPGPLLAIIAAVIVSGWFAMPIQYLKVPTQLFEAANVPSLGSLSMLLRGEILMAAIAMAIVASAESLLCASATDQLHQGTRTNYDKELIAQGVGNMTAGVFGALPITGVIVRSSANVEAGAKTRMSSILHGIWLLAFIVSMPFVLKLIPTAALAAVLVYIGYKLVNFKMMKELWSTNRTEFGIYVTTMASIVSFSLLTGVLIGVALSLFKIVYVFSHLGIQIEKDPESKRYDIYLEGSATFVRLPELAETLENLPQEAEIHIHLGGLTYIDHACIELLDQWDKQLNQTEGRLVIGWDALLKRSESKPLLQSQEDRPKTQQTKDSTGSKPANALT